MRKLHIVGLAFAAVFAFLAATAVSASAAEWLVEGAALAENLPAEIGSPTGPGLILLGRLVSETNSEVLEEIDCEGYLKGWIGPAGKDEITAVLNAAQELIQNLSETNPLPLSCIVEKSLNLEGDCPTGKLVEVWPDNLPWLTQLELVNNVLEDHVFGTGVLGGEPGWEVLCELFPFIFGEVLCEGLGYALISNEPGTTPASVLGEFMGTPEGECFEGSTQIPTPAFTLGDGDIWAVGGTVAAPVYLERLATAVN